MELANHPYEEGPVVGEGKTSTDVIVLDLPRKSSLTNNFSYPRSDGRLSRHESSVSRSSLASNSSIPGMTDSSDSDTSFEEDSSYNTSASELWDSFWPDNAVAPGEQYPVLLRASQTPNYFTKSFSKPEAQDADDTITISKLERDSMKKVTNSPCDTPTPQPSQPRPATRNGHPTYSVYPKQDPAMLRVALPPRISSLNAVPLSPPRRNKALKSAKSNANLKSNKPHQIQTLYPVPPLSKVPVLSGTASSLPVSPTYPPPPLPQSLRSASSAFNLRDKKSTLNRFQHHTTAPLMPLATLSVPSVPEPPSDSRPQVERYVSVFEIDSDHESYTESSSFTKRIARGFHKKSASEKRSSSSERRGSGSSESQGTEKGKESPSRKRGGSLGRILGLKSHK